jgi:YtcA family
MFDAHTLSLSTTVCPPIPSRFGHGRLALAILLPGCGSAPSINILGSFFPAWLICIVVGAVLTIFTRQVFVAMEIASHLRPAALVYPCLGLLWVFATRLVVSLARP